ncbi:MAG: phage portal protein [Parvibaculum sp.]|uniref:phage portal protein n=1 Tax=Parvibaculum sp. TaxID=2024848 RepID=UPI002ABC9EA7|nr:phage portal protein [Parvibaculum sp.]MDZ4382816.1 phage portal protein [Parvibaculum sp.]
MGLLDSWRGRLLSPSTAKFWTLFWGGESYAGKPVTQETALNVSAFWSCVRLISETIGTLPLELYKKEKDGTRTLADDHSLYGILKDSPNADQTAVEYWEGQGAFLCLKGNGFSLKEQSGRRLVSLMPLPDCLPYRTPEGEKRYRFNERGKTEEVPEEKIFHVKGFGTDIDLGLSPVSYARHTLGEALAAADARGNVFANGMRAPGFFVMPPGVGTLDQEQRKQARKTLIEKFTGKDATGKAGILEGGVRWESTSMNFEDAQMVQHFAQNIEEVCRWMRVPPILAGHSPAGQTMWGTGVEQIILSWLVTGLRAYLKRIEAAVTKRLLLPEERKLYKAEFNIDALLRADSKTRAEIFARGVATSRWTPNEVRAMDNQPPLAGGDRLLAQGALVPLDALGAAASPEQQMRSAIVAMIATAVAEQEAARRGAQTMEHAE